MKGLFIKGMQNEAKCFLKYFCSAAPKTFFHEKVFSSPLMYLTETFPWKSSWPELTLQLFKYDFRKVLYLKQNVAKSGPTRSIHQFLVEVWENPVERDPFKCCSQKEMLCV